MRNSFLFFSVIILLLFAMLLATCAKEYSYEGGPSAQYSIEGSPAECAPAILSGNYSVGVVVDESNHLQVTADVTSKGYYNISTIPVNGISFSSVGNFTDTGKQLVTLTGIGTPTSAGSFTVKIPGNNGCYITMNVKKKAPSSYTLSGYPADCSNPVISGKYEKDKQLTPDDTVALYVNVATPGTYIIQTDTVNGFSFSASGYFSKTGNQIVTLSSEGVPNTTGRSFFKVYADSSQCNFTIPVAPGLPQAVYVLEYPFDTICQGVKIQGKYISGVQLNNTNTVSFDVFVTVVGNYSIFTMNANGMVFGASGKFSVLGEQTVILSGSGTPSEAGNYKFVPAIIGPAPLGGNYCFYNVNVQ